MAEKWVSPKNWNGFDPEIHAPAYVRSYGCEGSADFGVTKILSPAERLALEAKFRRAPLSGADFDDAWENGPGRDAL